MNLDKIIEPGLISKDSLYLSYNKKKDLIDGEFYARIKQDNTLHLLVYADGVQPANSFKQECWPVIFTITELPRTLRDSFRNKLIAGIYIGNSKPTSDILFENLLHQICELNINGVTIVSDGNVIQLKVNFYGLLCDGPATSISMNMVSHSGYYPCRYCIVRGKINSIQIQILIQK